MQTNGKKNGFTLVELLVALVITGIVISTVATLAFAFGQARDFSELTSRRQSRIRFTTLKLSELIRNCRLVNFITDEKIAVWRDDENDDEKININELVFIDRGPERNYIKLIEYSDASIVDFGEVIIPNPGWNNNTIILIEECTDVEYHVDLAAPETNFLTISFDISEDSGIQHYQLSSRLRCRADYLIDD